MAVEEPIGAGSRASERAAKREKRGARAGGQREGKRDAVRYSRDGLSSVHSTLDSRLVRLSVSATPRPLSPPTFPLRVSPDDAALSGISPETDAARGHTSGLTCTARNHTQSRDLCAPRETDPRETDRLSETSDPADRRTRDHRPQRTTINAHNMSTKENNEVAVEKATENDKPTGDAKCEIKGIKRAAEVSSVSSFCFFFFFVFPFTYLYL